PAVLAGRLRSASGWQGLPAVEEPVAEAALRHVVELAGALVIAHCCAAGVPVGLFQRSGAVAVSLDADALGEAGVDALGEAADSGLGMVLGVVPATEAELSDLAVTVATVRVLGSRMGLSGERLIQTVALAPTCGLAGATPAYARAAMARCRAAGVRLREDPEG
ncbi:MAG: methionine synthase, partial [Actinomycetota bacterium]|nr:methionine synthase [Actinomycetota bacterium]